MWPRWSLTRSRAKRMTRAAHWASNEHRRKLQCPLQSVCLDQRMILVNVSELRFARLGAFTAVCQPNAPSVLPRLDRHAQCAFGLLTARRCHRCTLPCARRRLLMTSDTLGPVKLGLRGDFGLLLRLGPAAMRSH